MPLPAGRPHLRSLIPEELEALLASNGVAVHCTT